MSESSPPPDLVEITDPKELKAFKAELLEHQTRALKERMESQLGLGRLIYWAIGGLGGTVLVFLLTWIALFPARQGFLLATLTLIYMLGQGLILGIFAAALLVVARFLQQLATIIDITIQTLRESLSQARALGEGRTTFGELSAGLIHGALLPVVQDLITLKMGIIRLPISFIINRIMRRTVRRLTRVLHDPTKSPKKESAELAAIEKSADVDVSPTKLQQSLIQGETHLDRIQGRVDLIARRTRLATLLPAGIIFLFVSALSSIPWLLIFLTSL